MPTRNLLMYSLHNSYFFLFDFWRGLSRAVGSPLVMDTNSICRKSRRLAGKQQEICQNEKEIVAEVARGAQLAILECQFQFRLRKWNCTTARRSFAKVLRRGEEIPIPNYNSIDSRIEKTNKLEKQTNLSNLVSVTQYHRVMNVYFVKVIFTCILKYYRHIQVF